MEAIPLSLCIVNHIMNKHCRQSAAVQHGTHSRYVNESRLAFQSRHVDTKS